MKFYFFYNKINILFSIFELWKSHIFLFVLFLIYKIFELSSLSSATESFNHMLFRQVWNAVRVLFSMFSIVGGVMWWTESYIRGQLIWILWNTLCNFGILLVQGSMLHSWLDVILNMLSVHLSILK